MDTLLPFLLPAAIFLGLELLWCRQALARLLRRAPEPERDGTAPPHHPDEDLFTLSFVQHRLDVLAAELDRIDNDDTIYARAFRMYAVKAACEALRADAARLTAVPTVELEITRSLTPLREEIEV